MKRKYESCVSFAKFCILHNLLPYDLAKLCELADRCHSLAVRKLNDSTRSSRGLHKARSAFEEAARDMGFNTVWEGLDPTLIPSAERSTSGRPTSLPS